MERSQSYTSFETTGTTRHSQQTNHLSGGGGGGGGGSSSSSISHFHHSASSGNLDSYFKDKFASTSSLNLRKALELRQTQLQLQQQEQLQRQQWQLLFEQRRRLQQQQIVERLQHAASIDQLESPLYQRAFNNLQLLQSRRQNLFQQQKTSTPKPAPAPSPSPMSSPTSAISIATTSTTTASAISSDDFLLDYQLHDDEDDNDDGAGDDDENYGIVLREHTHTHTHETSADDNDPISVVNNGSGNNEIHQRQNQTAAAAIPHKLQRFQRQRPYSETSINFPTAPLSPTFAASSSSTAATSNIANTERHRLQSFEQALSFDSAIGTTTHNMSNSGTNPNNSNSKSKCKSSSCSSSSSSSSSNNNNSNKANSSNNNTDKMSPLSPRHPHFGKLKRDNSLHSDSSRYSSVDSLLEARKPDPEAILINLGFGPIVSEDILSRIPKRFLKPSQVRGIDTDAFIKRLQLANSLADHSVLGYRGLIGNPDLPPSTIVAKIMERFEVNERKKSMGSIEQTMR